MSTMGRDLRIRTALVASTVLLGCVAVLPYSSMGSASVASPPARASSGSSPRLTSGELPSQGLYGWGENEFGQLGNGLSGNGVSTPTPTPTQIAPGVQFSSVASGGAHTLALTKSGTVFAWGSNGHGQLGTGSLTSATTPQAVTVPGGPVVAIAAGSNFSLALDASGQVYAWGAGLSGQLGDASNANVDSPVQVQLPVGITATLIAAGGDHALVLDSNGDLYAWGSNFAGQLGNNSMTASNVPVAVLPPTAGTVSYTAIAAGTAHSLAIATTGAAYAWGSNASGQLGDGVLGEQNLRPDSFVPTQVSMPAGITITQIAAGASHSIALGNDGHVYDWGSNVFGQLGFNLGVGLPVDSDIPSTPTGLPPVTTFVGVAAGSGSSYALSTAGVMWGWGSDFSDQLGYDYNGSANSTNAWPPQAITSLPSGTEGLTIDSGPNSSAAFLVTRQAQTITFPSLQPITYGTTPITFVPTATSGGPVTVSAVGACRTYSTNLSFVGAGSCTVEASQAGTSSYYPAPTTALNLTVAQATLTITPRSATSYLAQPFPTFAYGLSGFQLQDSTSDVSGTASCTTSPEARTVPGVYPITCATGTLNSANYGFVSGPSATLTVIGSSTDYAVIGSNGAVYANGASSAPFFGSLLGLPLNAAVVGGAFTPSHHGYWMVASDGGIFSFGDAGFYGSMGGSHLNRPIVGMASTPDGGGYWLVASDGGIFSFGDASFYGSMGGTPLNRPVNGMASTADGHGYWMVASDGGIFSFGDAGFYGSAGSLGLQTPVVGMANDPVAGGYWLTTATGLIFNFGAASFEGSLQYESLQQPVVGIVASATGGGYWLAGKDGGIFAFGDAGFYGVDSAPGGSAVGII